MRLFLERSFDQVTIAGIAEAADVSVNTVFNYFPTKEDLFFSSYPGSQSVLVGLAKARKPHESVIAFLKRVLHEDIERYTKTPMSLAEIAYLSAMRRVVQESSALRVHAAQTARRVTQDAEESLAKALAKDVQAEANDVGPRLVAGQVFAIYSTLFLEAEQPAASGRKTGKDPSRTERRGRDGFALAGARHR